MRSAARRIATPVLLEKAEKMWLFSGMETLLDSRKPLGPARFAINTAILLLIGVVAGFLVYKAGYIFLHFKTVGIFWALCVWIFIGIAWFIQMIRRSRDLGIAPILLFIPGYNLYLLYLLFSKGGTRAEQQDNA